MPQEIKVKVAIKGDMVMVDFETLVKTISLSGNQAIEIGNALIRRGRQINKTAGKKLPRPGRSKQRDS